MTKAQGKLRASKINKPPQHSAQACGHGQIVTQNSGLVVFLEREDASERQPGRAALSLLSYLLLPFFFSPSVV